MKCFINKSGETCFGHLDTGSEISLISRPLLKQLQLEFKTVPSWTALITISGHLSQSNQLVKTLISFENSPNLKPIPIELQVVDVDEDILILGNDLILQNNFLIDYRSRAMCGNNNAPRLIIDPHSQTVKKCGNVNILSAPLYDKVAASCVANSHKVMNSISPYIKINNFLNNNGIRVPSNQAMPLGLVDSGSNISLVKYDTVKKLNLWNSTFDENNKYVITGLTGKKSTSVGNIILNIQFSVAGPVFSFRFVIVTDLHDEIIFGMDFLSMFNLTPRFLRNELTDFRQISIPLFYPTRASFNTNLDEFFNCSYSNINNMVQRDMKNGVQQCGDNPRKLGQWRALKKVRMLLHLFVRDKMSFWEMYMDQIRKSITTRTWPFLQTFCQNFAQNRQQTTAFSEGKHLRLLEDDAQKVTKKAVSFNPDVAIISQKIPQKSETAPEVFKNEIRFQLFNNQLEFPKIKENGLPYINLLPCEQDIRKVFSSNVKISLTLKNKKESNVENIKDLLENELKNGKIPSFQFNSDEKNSENQHKSDRNLWENLPFFKSNVEAHNAEPVGKKKMGVKNVEQKCKNTVKFRLMSNQKLKPRAETVFWETIPKAFYKKYKNSYALFSPCGIEVEKDVYSNVFSNNIAMCASVVKVKKYIPLKAINLSKRKGFLPKNNLVGTLQILTDNDTLTPVKKSNMTYGEKMEEINKAKNAKTADAEKEPVLTKEECLTEINNIIEKHPWAGEINVYEKCTAYQKLKILQTFVKHEKAVSKHEFDLGLYEKFNVQIPTVDEIPVYTSQYRVPLMKQEFADQHVRKLLEHDIIEEASTGFNSPYLLVKKSGSNKLRFAIDYRNLNKKVKKFTVKIPDIRTCLDCLQNNSMFSKLDLSMGYHQLGIAPEDRHKTAFSALGMKFQYKRLSFGLKTSPFWFSLAMAEAMNKLNFQSVILYVDDLLVYSQNFESHIERLDQVLEKLEEANLKVKPGKCTIASPILKFLGVLVSEKGLQPDPEKIRAILEMPAPRSVKAVQRFMGMVTYHGSFIPRLAELSACITDLTRKGTPWNWTPECEKNFQILKSALCNSPILVHPDFNKEFVISSDSSFFAAGACLMQADEKGKMRVIRYFSHKWTPSERMYRTFEKETLALIKAIKNFECYIWGRKFRVITDCTAVVYFKNLARPTAIHSRWILFLDSLNYDIEHRSGSKHVDSDFISRFEHLEFDEEITSNERYTIFLETKFHPNEVKMWRKAVNNFLKWQVTSNVEDLTVGPHENDKFIEEKGRKHHKNSPKMVRVQ